MNILAPFDSVKFDLIYLRKKKIEKREERHRNSKDIADNSRSSLAITRVSLHNNRYATLRAC